MIKREKKYETFSKNFCFYFSFFFKKISFFPVNLKKWARYIYFFIGLSILIKYSKFLASFLVFASIKTHDL